MNKTESSGDPFHGFILGSLFTVMSFIYRRLFTTDNFSAIIELWGFAREKQTCALLPGGGLRGRRGSLIVGGSGCLVAAERGCALGGPPRFHLLATSANRRESRENVSHTRGTIGRQRPIIPSPEHD